MLSRLAKPSIRLSAYSTARCATSLAGRSQNVVAPSFAACVSPAQRTFSSQFSDSDSITYSGGQASEGQGGFYGSGGARASIQPTTEHKPEMVALAADVENLTLVMEEVDKLEQLLEEEKEKAMNDDEKNRSGVTSKTLEISSKIKKIMTSVDVMECLNRLEVEGEPVWGLSSKERDLVYAARQKVNEC